MKKISLLFIVISLFIFVAGCQKEQATPKNPITPILKNFAKNRKAGMVKYGVINVQNKQQNTSKIDCMVFNRAAKSPTPQSLGMLSALTSSMKLRIQLGCSKTENVLVSYETARRLLKSTWQQKLKSLTYPEMTLLKSSKMGKFLHNQIQDVTSEDMVCWSKNAIKARKRNWSTSLHEIEIDCKTGISSRREEQCNYAWYVAYAHQKANGERDNLSYLAELVARYRMMFLSCSPQSTNEYLQYHQVVPKELYQGPAYRFRIAIDPIMACQLRHIQSRLNKGYNINPKIQWINCAKKWGLQSLYSTESIPKMVSSAMLQGKAESHRGKWLFNPEEANKNPDVWTFNKCDKKVIHYLQKNGLNLSSPYSIKRYCKIHGND